MIPNSLSYNFISKYPDVIEITSNLWKKNCTVKKFVATVTIKNVVVYILHAHTYWPPWPQAKRGVAKFWFFGGGRGGGCAGSILESKAMHVIFQKKGKKRAKYLKIWAKMNKILKYFEKGQPHLCNWNSWKGWRGF